MKKFRKLDNSWRSYGQEFGVVFLTRGVDGFDIQVYILLQC